MNDDLIARLRSPATVFYEYAADEGALLREAAAVIERLAAALEVAERQLAEAREVLKTYICTCPEGYCEVGAFDDTICGHRARAALGRE